LRYNYDILAPIYDRLSRLVFGRAQVDAQLYLIEAIHAGTRVLIIGGGTGRILEAIGQQQPGGLRITYIDASAKMIAMAKQRNAGNNHVTFINANIEDAVLQGPFDIVLTPFLLDNFREEDLSAVISKIEGSLAPAATWLHCDFRNSPKLWHKLLLQTMYVFFRLCCGIKAKHLPDVERVFAQLQWKPVSQKTFFDGMIVAVVYKKKADLNGQPL
jgi:ubiquinone/menaquinone biosynthesis C-methylase UbiE